MRKQILGVMLFLSAVAMLSGVVSAEVNFVAPTENEIVNGDYLVQWNNTDEEILTLDYKTLNNGNWVHLIENIDVNQTSYLWRTTDFNNSPGTLRLIGREITSVNVVIDNNPPFAEVSVLQEGYENDEMSDVSKTIISINASDENAIVSCEILWGDVQNEIPTDCLNNPIGIYEHQYADNGDYNVKLTVKDNIGNENSDSEIIEVANVPPICWGIDGPTQSLIGLEVEFTGNVTDVEADEGTLNYSWNFGDNSSLSEGNPVSHIYRTQGVFSVNLTAKDKDGGEAMCSREITIVGPTLLQMQEVAAYYELESDFGENAGEAPHSFKTGLTGDVTCEIQNLPEEIPEGFQVYAVGSDCVVEWGSQINAKPINDMRGEHPFFVKATNGEELRYYSFSVVVYSWIIPLHTGWNLISIPLVAENNNSVQKVILEQISGNMSGGTEYTIFSYQYNPTTKESTWLRSRKSGFGTLPTVDPGYAYFINVINETEIKGFGTQVLKGAPNQPPGIIPQVFVPKNQWSLIGRYGIINNINPKQAGALSKEIALQSFLRPQRTGQVYKTDGEGHISLVEELENNLGFWLYTNSNGAVEEVTYTPTDGFYDKN